ncbi:hypothetical protein ABBQ38_015042 [Trebouxia sp. C0009 RCD-2024]
MAECCAWEQTGHRSPRRRIKQGIWQHIPQLSPFPYLSLTDVLQAAPRLLELVSPEDKKSLSAVCTSMRRLVHACASFVSLQKGDTLQHLLDTAAGPRLQVLQLQDIRLTVTAIPGLTSAPWSVLLVSLTLSNCGLEPSTISKLAAGYWPMLQHLSFRNNSLSTAAIKAMAGGQWPRLEHLDLSSIKLNAEGIAELIQLSWSRLSGLELQGNPDIDAKAFRMLASGVWPCLKGLAISGSFTLNYFVRQAASPLRLLESVYLNCNYSPQAVNFAGAWQNMQSMRIKTRCPTSAYIAILPKPLKLELKGAAWCNLQSLDLSYSHLGGQGIAQLALGDWPWLCQLDVSHLEFTEEDYIPDDYAGLASGRWPQLTYLCLADNAMYDEYAAELTVANWPKLRVLDLSHNCIGVTGSAALDQGNWPEMEHLCLHENQPECICPTCFLDELAGF